MLFLWQMSVRKLLCISVSPRTLYVIVVHFVADDFCRDSRSCGVLWNVFYYHCSCSDCGIRTYRYVFNDANVRTEINVVADNGGFTVICAYSGELAYIAIVADNGGRVYNYAHIMVHQKSETDSSGFNNVNICVLTNSVKHKLGEIVSPTVIRR